MNTGKLDRREEYGAERSHLDTSQAGNGVKCIWYAYTCMYVCIAFFEVCLYRSKDGMVIQVGNRAFMSNNNISLSNAVQENLWNLEVRALPYVSIPDTIFICIYIHAVYAFVIYLFLYRYV